MQESYQEPSYEEQYDYYQEPPKKGPSGWLIALLIVLALVVICCLCLCVSSALFGPAVGNTFSVIIEEMGTPIP